MNGIPTLLQIKNQMSVSKPIPNGFESKPYRSVTSRHDHQYVIDKIKRLMDQLPEVEQLKGTISLKLKGVPVKTLTFNYK